MVSQIAYGQALSYELDNYGGFKITNQTAVNENFDPANTNRLGTIEYIVSGPVSNVCAGPGCPTGTPSCKGLPVELDGNELPHAPQYSANLGAGYTWPLENGMEPGTCGLSFGYNF